MPPEALLTKTRPFRVTEEQRVPAKLTVAEPRLDALTSLRFFAASMILLLHMSQLFGFNNNNCLSGLALWQGVSFFFVLSGFILAYVYPKIDTAAQSKQFLIARFARIWPTHLAAFLFTIALVPSVLQLPNLIPTAVANLCLVQVWTFNPAMSESFNSVSWTISIELFFYLCFPFLIKDFDRTPKLRWLAACVLSLSFIALCMAPGAMGFASNALPASLYLGENPACRLLEFTLGIAACWMFKKRPQIKHLSKVQATVLEVVTLGAIACAISLSNIWPAQDASGAMSVLRAWAIDMGGAPAYAALILLIATERGLVAKFLNKRILVRLGEISFSMYMFHLSILYALVKYQSSFANLPGWVLPAVGVLLCLIISHLNFSLIETPVRRWIMGLSHGARDETSTIAQNAFSSWFDDIVFSAPIPLSRPKALPARVSNRPQVWVVAEIAAMLVIVTWLNVQFRFIPPGIAQRIESHSIPTTRDIEFGGKFRLRGLKLSKKPEGLYMDAVWESLGNQKLENLNAVEVIDAKSKTMSAKTYPQDSFNRAVAGGKIWQDKIFIPTDKLKGALRVGISLHTPPDGTPLLANKGVTDGNNVRLLVAIP